MDRYSFANIPVNWFACLARNAGELETPLTWNHYLLLCLGSGGKISGSNTSLMSEFSVKSALLLMLRRLGVRDAQNRT